MGFFHSVTAKKLFFILVSTSALFSSATSDGNKDREECTQQLVGLATCLQYVSGNAKAPTPDCCNGLKQVLKTNKKCLCVVIEDRNDPDLGLNINVTLALGLPTVCHAPANITRCPELLHLPPNSPDAQVFYQYGGDSGGSRASSPSATDNPASVSVNTRAAPARNDGCFSGIKRWGLIEVVVGGVSVWAFTLSLI